MANTRTQFGDFSVGDIVNLKSGGPDMTVEGFEAPAGSDPNDPNVDPHVKVVWANENGSVAREKFSAAVLGIKTSARDQPRSAPPSAPKQPGPAAP